MGMLFRDVMISCLPWGSSGYRLVMAPCSPQMKAMLVAWTCPRWREMSRIRAFSSPIGDCFKTIRSQGGRNLTGETDRPMHMSFVRSSDGGVICPQSISADHATVIACRPGLDIVLPIYIPYVSPRAGALKHSPLHPLHPSRKNTQQADK